MKKDVKTSDKCEESEELSKLVTIKDFAAEVGERLAKIHLEYFQSGPNEEESFKENNGVFQRWKIMPRVFREAAQVVGSSCETRILGKQVSLPVGISPVTFQRLANFEGEIAAAKAAAGAGSVFCLATFATCSIEQVAEAIPEGRKWLQLFIFEDREITKSLIRRAEKNGYEALVITVDSLPVEKRRKRKQIKLPKPFKMANFDPVASLEGNVADCDLSKLCHQHNDTGFEMTWDVVHWLKQTTTLPIIIKGILTPKDAELAVQNFVSAIWISGNGGNPLDHGIPAIDMLPLIRDKVAGKCEVYLDGGITKGTDVYKALALGADMVFMGRPFIWGLATGGEEGVGKIFKIMEKELKAAMTFAGVKSVHGIRHSLVTKTAVPLIRMKCKM